MAPHTPSTEAIDVPVGSANGIQGARHILICVRMKMMPYACIHEFLHLCTYFHHIILKKFPTKTFFKTHQV